MTYYCNNIIFVHSHLIAPSDHRYFFWMKPKNPGYTTLDHQNYHRATLAFVSDVFMAGCVRSAFPRVKMSTITSLDHSIWFHTDCNCQGWHLFVIQCDHCKGGRSLNSSRYYTSYRDCIVCIIMCMHDMLVCDISVCDYFLAGSIEKMVH